RNRLLSGRGTKIQETVHGSDRQESSLKFSRIYDLNPLYLYVLVMSPYAVFYGALEGTELLFLSFLTLMLAEIHRPRAGAVFDTRNSEEMPKRDDRSGL
ncbi:hypothetical protein HRED_10147, partial [Candidatus Haloredivivus sp. G17]